MAYIYNLFFLKAASLNMDFCDNIPEKLNSCDSVARRPGVLCNHTSQRCSFAIYLLCVFKFKILKDNAIRGETSWAAPDEILSAWCALPT